MSTRIRRGTHGPTASLRTEQRRACAREERELAALAEVDALLAESRVYLAIRDGDGRTAVDVVSGHGADRAALAVSEPDWGARGDGTLRLAAALLADALHRPPDEALAHAFTDDVLRHVPHQGFALSAVDVRGWTLFHVAIELPERWS